MTRFGMFAATVTVAIGVSPAAACSLCSGINLRTTLRMDVELAKAVYYGSISNPRFTDNGLGKGITDFHVEQVLKLTPNAPKPRLLELNSYIPVLDKQNPPKFIVFCEIIDGKPKVYTARTVESPAVLRYLEKIKSLNVMKRSEFLKKYFDYLDHDDPTIAEDAFLEFAHADDRDVGEVGPHLDPVKLRKLLTDPETDPRHLSLLAFLLGTCGKEKDAELLRNMLDSPSQRARQAFDGLLGGYMQLRPKTGWKLTEKLLSDQKRSFLQRMDAVRTVRFYHNWKPGVYRQQIERCHKVMIADGDLATQAIDDLRRWKRWNLTSHILDQWGKDSHKAPSTRRTIVAYALFCPEAEAAAFIKRLRRDAGTRAFVEDIEERLSFDLKQ